MDNEVALSVEITEAGVKAKSKSRLISGLDRLVGNASEWLSARMEDDISTRRAVTEGNRKLIEAATKEGVRRIARDPAFAERALKKHFGGILQAQANREAVADKALEDLTADPPTEEQSNSGADQIAPEILDRLDTYASGASTDEIRERWGRITAAEIRKPGTFSLKVLRIIDELDKDIALIFEEFAESRLENLVPKVLCRELAYVNQIRMVDAGLLIDPGLGQSSSFSVTEIGDQKHWAIKLGTEVFTIPTTDFQAAKSIGSKEAVFNYNNKPAVPVYIFTDAGLSICKILPPTNNESRFFAELRKQFPTAKRWHFDAGQQMIFGVADV